MPAGWLRERVTLQERDPNAVANAYNEKPNTWRDLLAEQPAQVYAFTRFGSTGAEFVAAHQVQVGLSHKVTLRTPTQIAIRPEHRFVWVERLIGGTEITHYLDIKQVVPLITRRGYSECLCQEFLGV